MPECRPVSDAIDLAQELEERYRSEALAAHRASHIVGDGEQIVHPRDCLQCGDEIPMPRLLLDTSARRCTPCQALYEAHR